MKTAPLLTAASLAVLSWIVNTPVMAQTEPVKSREQVRQELMEAVRTGNIPCNDDSGRLMREVYPSRYPQAPAAEAKTREQVQQELREAIRTGDMPANDESGHKLKEVHPGMYPMR